MNGSHLRIRILAIICLILPISISALFGRCLFCIPGHHSCGGLGYLVGRDLELEWLWPLERSRNIYASISGLSRKGYAGIPFREHKHRHAHLHLEQGCE
jgi:hypothetical protein